MKKISLALFFLGLLIWFLGCGKSSSNNPVISSITISPTSANLTVGATQTFTARARDSQGNPVTFTPVWSVVGSIGTISTGGVFTATTAGTGQVKASSGGVSGEANVTVTASDGDGDDHHGLRNLFFLHHSTGANLISEGGVRNHIANYNSSHSTNFAFWDHGYNSDGLTNAQGQATGANYGVPSDNTDPDGLYYLWTSSNEDAAACRNQIMANHEVIAFKSCFPASAITSDEMLNQYKTWYLEMRNYFDTHPEKLFVVMSTPPLHRRPKLNFLFFSPAWLLRFYPPAPQWLLFEKPRPLQEFWPGLVCFYAPS